MSVDFFNSSCSEVHRNDSEFGLCDDENGSKAYTDISNKSKWIAVVKNDDNINVQFTAIDNCLKIRKPDSTNLESTCDCMLTFENSLFLIELKNLRSDWITDSIDQLENTIHLLKGTDELEQFRFKKAFASNKKRAFFNVLDPERKKRFFDKTGFRLDASARIIVK